MGLEDTTAQAPEAPAVTEAAEPAQAPVDEARREREAQRGRVRRAKEREKRSKELGIAPAPAAAQLEPVAPAAPRGPSPERLAKIAGQLNDALKDSAGTIGPFIPEKNVTVPADVARAICGVLSTDEARGRLANAWAPLIAHLSPEDGPPSPYASAAFGSILFALAVGATTFAIRDQRGQPQ